MLKLLLIGAVLIAGAMMLNGNGNIGGSGFGGKSGGFKSYANAPKSAIGGIKSAAGNIGN
jgi:hypothetical protein